MNNKFKLAIIWGAIAASLLVVFNFFLHLAGGPQSKIAAFREVRPEGRGHHGGFGHQPFMTNSHHGGDFSWLAFLLILLLGLAIVVLFVRWLRKKAKASSMQQFIETPVTGSHIPVINQNARLLDNWEKNIAQKGDQ